MISVVVATYNGEKYIIQELESIMRQTLLPDQVIISDDGSTDSTVTLVNDFIAKNNLSGMNWKVIIRKKNLGIQKNFLYSVMETKGDYIFLADQDDIWCENKIETMCNMMCQNEQLLLLSCRYDLIDYEGKQYKGKQRVLHADYRPNGHLEFIQKSDLLISSFIRGCSMCIRGELRQYIDKDFELNAALGHDWYLCLLACSYGKAAFYNRRLMYYRVHGTNVSIKEKPFYLSDNRKMNVELLRSASKSAQRIVMNDKIAKEQLIRFCQFLDQRLQLFDCISVGKAITLLRKHPMYQIYRHSWWGGWETYAADLIYSWHTLKNREK